MKITSFNIGKSSYSYKYMGCLKNNSVKSSRGSVGFKRPTWDLSRSLKTIYKLGDLKNFQQECDVLRGYLAINKAINQNLRVNPVNLQGMSLKIATWNNYPILGPRAHCSNHNFLGRFVGQARNFHGHSQEK